MHGSSVSLYLDRSPHHHRTGPDALVGGGGLVGMLVNNFIIRAGSLGSRMTTSHPQRTGTFSGTSERFLACRGKITQAGNARFALGPNHPDTTVTR